MNNFLFDLDGTLTDSEEGIIKAFHYTLERLNIKNISDNTLREFIGPPLNETFKRRFDLIGEENDRAISYFREYYSKDGKYENVPYKGMDKLLKNVSKENVLAVATSKVEDQAIDIVEHFYGKEYFSFIGGASKDSKRSKKYDIIKYVISNLNIEDLSNTYMIGDRFTDINGARRIGIKSIGVLWGFGSREELEECNADYIVESVEELEKLLLSL